LIVHRPVQVLESARVCLRAGCHTVARKPGAGNALLEYRRKYRIIDRAGR
jgi:hypothetical protein